MGNRMRRPLGGRRGPGPGFPSLAQPSPLPPALRKARREQQLVSKRLLRDDAPEEADGGCVAPILGEAEVRGAGCAVRSTPAGTRFLP